MNKKKTIIFVIIGIISICIFATSVCIWLMRRNNETDKITEIEYESIMFEVVDDIFSDEDFQDTVRKIEKRAYELDDKAVVLKEGMNKVIVKIPCNSEATYMMESIGKKGEIQFITDLGDAEKEKVWLDGDCIKQAEASIYKAETGINEYIVNIEFNEDATDKLAEATSNNIGKMMYIVYDGEVISQPFVQQKITGGQIIINGIDTYDEAEQLAALLRIGTIKLEMKVISKEEGEKND